MKTVPSPSAATPDAFLKSPGLLAGTCFHLEPVHRAVSTFGLSFESKYTPAAQTAPVGDADTAYEASPWPASLPGTTVQTWPSQCSARVLVSLCDPSRM